MQSSTLLSASRDDINNIVREMLANFCHEWEYRFDMLHVTQRQIEDFSKAGVIGMSKASSRMGSPPHKKNEKKKID